VYCICCSVSEVFRCHFILCFCIQELTEEMKTLENSSSEQIATLTENGKKIRKVVHCSRFAVDACS